MQRLRFGTVFLRQRPRNRDIVNFVGEEHGALEERTPWIQELQNTKVKFQPRKQQHGLWVVHVSTPLSTYKPNHTSTTSTRIPPIMSASKRMAIPTTTPMINICSNVKRQTAVSKVTRRWQPGMQQQQQITQGLRESLAGRQSPRNLSLENLKGSLISPTDG